LDSEIEVGDTESSEFWIEQKKMLADYNLRLTLGINLIDALNPELLMRFTCTSLTINFIEQRLRDVFFT
jgi:hypothetical protein